jgi:hypothetical protein
MVDQVPRRAAVLPGDGEGRGLRRVWVWQEGWEQDVLRRKRWRCGMRQRERFDKAGVVRGIVWWHGLAMLLPAARGWPLVSDAGAPRRSVRAQPSVERGHRARASDDLSSLVVSGLLAV